MVADDARGILMRNRFAEAIILQEGGQYEAHNRIPCSAQKAPEQHLSDACREIKTIFQEAEQQVNAHHGGGCKQHPPDQPVQVKLPDKRIQPAQQQLIMTLTTHLISNINEDCANKVWGVTKFNMGGIGQIRMEK